VSTKRSKKPDKLNTIDRADALDILLKNDIDLHGKRIFLSDTVGEYMYDNLLKGLTILNQAADTKEITVIINTGGGDLYQALAMYDLIKKNKIPVDVVCQGLCMSAGTLILQAARTRISDPHCQFMIHYGYEYSGGEARTARRFNEHYIKLEETVCELYATRMKKTYQQVDALLDRDTFMTAQEALDNGLIDEIS
jgi:ATP-dependent Clp protease protease subunit